MIQKKDCGMKERRTVVPAKEFNLLEEPWIKVTTLGLETKEVSLIEAISHAHEYRGLAGEMATQDFAMLRILLAICQTIFYYYDEDGNRNELSEENGFEKVDVLERWCEYLQRGKFDEKIVADYLQKYQERFWLIHPETPFWQVPNLQYGTEYTNGMCLSGNVKESNNPKTRHHFSMFDSTSEISFEYAEATRWLIHLNAYGVNVKQDKKAPGTRNSVGTGRLGRMGSIHVKGTNLFQILMMNLTPLKNSDDLWGKPKPAWEKPLRTDQGHLIAPPDNLPELYTIQSRRITLLYKNNRVTGFRTMGGDYYPLENDPIEPMTIWERKEKGKQIIFEPRIHDPSIHAWREFPSLFCENDNAAVPTPGIVKWTKTLVEEEQIPESQMITYRMIGLTYDGMKYNYVDIVDDSLTLSAHLLENKSSIWISYINDEIQKCRTTADTITFFANKIVAFYYGEDNKKRKAIQSQLISQYYSLIDQPFRLWLMNIDPVTNKKEQTLCSWEKTSRKIAMKVANDYIDSLGVHAYLVKDKGKSDSSVFQILNKYAYKITNIYPITEHLAENTNQKGEIM